MFPPRHGPLRFPVLAIALEQGVHDTLKEVLGPLARVDEKRESAHE
jgi:hypothetical protein